MNCDSQIVNEAKDQLARLFQDTKFMRKYMQFLGANKVMEDHYAEERVRIDKSINKQS